QAPVADGQRLARPHLCEELLEHDVGEGRRALGRNHHIARVDLLHHLDAALAAFRIAHRGLLHTREVGAAHANTLDRGAWKGNTRSSMGILRGFVVPLLLLPLAWAAGALWFDGPASRALAGALALIVGLGGALSLLLL